jgi:hypothetical protein
MKRFLLFLIIILAPINVLAVSGTSTFSVDIEVNNCNYNNVCEDLIDENFLTCESDCPAVCVINGVCEAAIGETIVNCAQDCVVTPTTTTSTVPVVVASGGGGGFISPSYVVLNVVNLLAKPGDSNVVLTWEVLDNLNYGGVLIKRSELFPVSTVGGGGILYKGKGEFVQNNQYYLNDLNLINGRWYYYTVYLFDNNGTFASGASVSALPQSDKMTEDLGNLVIPPKKLPPELSIPKKITATTSSIIKIELIQKNTIIEFDNNRVVPFVLEPNVTTTIFVSKKDIPEGVKAITATIESAEGFQTLFLKKEASGDFFLVIPAVSLSKGGSLIFTFVDDKNIAVDRVSGTIDNNVNVKPALREKSVILSKIYKAKSLIINFLNPIYKMFLDLIALMFDLAIRVLKLLKYWVNILGVLVIHK